MYGARCWSSSGRCAMRTMTFLTIDGMLCVLAIFALVELMPKAEHGKTCKSKSSHLVSVLNCHICLAYMACSSLMMKFASMGSIGCRSAHGRSILRYEV
mmetsp:Transcript_49802/g.106684  ORF Transcript_49802/g.106684 Transcript_49802/m.106684 type:complete len:99 (+) Transcript_49802:133-429(+)